MYVKVPRVAAGNVKKFISPYHGPYVITKSRRLNADISALGISGHPVGVEFVTHLQRLEKAKAPLTHTPFEPAKFVSVKKSGEDNSKPSTNPTSDEVNNKPRHRYNLRVRK